jgi:uncharacterized OsmC-like protein
MAEQMNDVNLEGLKHLDTMVRDNPALGKMTVKVQSTWERGTKATITVGAVHAMGQNLFPRTRRFVITSDEPAPLGGVDSAPFPPELLLAALSACVTTGIATNAALFDVPLDAMGIDMEADIDVRGMLGHDKAVRNGITDIRYTVTIQSPAPEEKVRRCKETIDRKSPIRDTLANPVNVTSELVYKQS